MRDSTTPRNPNRMSTKRLSYKGELRFSNSPQFAIVLGEELGQIQISTIVKHLTNNGLIVLQSQTLDRKKNLIFVELSNALLVFKEAQELQILKSHSVAAAILPSNINTSTSPQKIIQSEILPNEQSNSHVRFSDQIYQSSKADQMQESNKINSNNMNKNNIFGFDFMKTPIKQSISLSDNSHFHTDFIIEEQKQVNNHVVPKDQQEKRLNSIDPRILLYERLRVVSPDMFRDTATDERELKFALTKALGIFTPAERLRITYSYMSKIVIKDIRLIEFLQEQESIEEIVPLHEKNAIINNNIQSIEDYYGENISIYFEFLDFYQKSLLYPALLSIPVYIQSLYLTPSTAQTIQFIYSLFICLWMTAFYIAWRRNESELQVKWGVFGKKVYKEDRNVNFKGIKRIKSTTLVEEEYYPKSKRFYLYLLSAIESLPLLLITFLLKLVIFNLNGLINSEESILYLPSVAGLVKTGGLLHSLPLKDPLLNVVLIAIIIKVNEVYTHLSEKSTIRENHRTNNDFNESLVIKRFIFDLINRFTHFFFIAFVIRDIDSLKSLLSSLFLMDEVRKIATESVIPWLIKVFLAQKKQKGAESTDETLKRNEEMNSLYAESIREIDTWPYDNFDDYIEVVAQIAFVTMFASVSPLAALLSYLFNFFERHSDKFKLQKRLYRRPLPFKVTGIGAWNKVIFLISIICVYTNVAFLAYDYFNIYELTRNSLVQVCTDAEAPQLNPVTKLYVYPVNIAVKNGEITWLKVYLSIFTLEHLIIISIVCFHSIFQYYPKWVRVYRRRSISKQTPLL